MCPAVHRTASARIQPEPTDCTSARCYDQHPVGAPTITGREQTRGKFGEPDSAVVGAARPLRLAQRLFERAWTEHHRPPRHGGGVGLARVLPRLRLVGSATRLRVAGGLARLAGSCAGRRVRGAVDDAMADAASVDRLRHRWQRHDRRGLPDPSPIRSSDWWAAPVLL